MHGHSVVTVEPSDAARVRKLEALSSRLMELSNQTAEQMLALTAIAVMDTRSGEVRFRGIHFCRGCMSEAALSLRETVEIVDEIVRMEATSD